MRRLDAWNKTQKNEMETGDEMCLITEREMVDQSCGMEPRIQLKIQDQQSGGKTKERWEDDINEFLKFVEGRDRKPDRKQQPNQQNMNQHSKRPRKMGSTRRKLHNDFRRKT